MVMMRERERDLEREREKEADKCEMLLYMMMDGHGSTIYGTALSSRSFSQLLAAA